MSDLTDLEENRSSLHCYLHPFFPKILILLNDSSEADLIESPLTTTLDLKSSITQELFYFLVLY